jgi:hypothetical protein
MDKQIAYLQNRIRQLTHELEIIRTRASGLEVRLKYAGLTHKEQKRLWNLCQKKDFGKMEDFLMRILSPNIWLTEAEYRELMEHTP